MKMRKIIAVLAAVLMLCAIIPMGVFAADGDVVISLDWNDGEKKFDIGEVVAEGPDGSNCYKWAFGGGWASNYMVVKNMDPNKNYTITMMAKGSANGSMGITIQNGDWGSYWNGPTFNVTTEWQEVVITLPANGIPFTAGSILFKFQGNGGSAYDLYVDNMVISEGLPKKPLCENGDFETGDGTNWSLHQNSKVDTTAAHDGSYGAHLYGAQNWNSMMERTFDVEAGKNYELTFWAKAVSGGANIKFLDKNWQGTALASGIWFSSSNWTQKTVTFTAVSDKFYLNFCGAGPDSAAEELYIDSVTLLEVKDPSFDGYIYNGDFETGKSGSWTNLWGSSTVEIVEGRNGGYALKGTGNGAYHIVYQEVNVTPNTNYTVWAYTKNASNSNLWIKNAGGNGDITNKAFASGEWALTSVTFNSGSNNTVWVGLMALAAGATYTVDDIFMFEAKAESNDGYIKNGDFETGSVSPWNNLWGSCPTVEIIKGGKDDNFALNLVSGEWKHLRQTGIAVEANTDYKITLWSKNVKNMNLLVKDNGDSANIVNKGIANSDDWAKTEITFNTGANTAILISLMGGAAEAYGQFDNIVMEKLHTCNVVEQNRVDADCVNDGYIEYACDCGLGAYTETIPATGHTAGAAADCTNAQVCTVCGAELAAALGHSYDAVVTAPDCENGGYTTYTCACGDTYTADETAALGHSYDNEFDVDCNVCGDTREVKAPIIDVKLSISEDVNGLAFRFEANVAGFAIKAGTFVQADYTNATYNGYKLIESGAIASAANAGSITIKGERMCDLDENGKALFAYRVINIPADKQDVEITMKPYYIIEIDGVVTTIYGEAQVGAYAEVAVG